MKLLIGIFIVSLVSCSNKKPQAPDIADLKKPEAPQEENYFPVTVYIKGQINDIRLKAINPLRLNIQGGRTDSAWLKIESLDTVFNDFLTPVIDTANFKNMFSESKFLDNSIGSYTWTYEPVTDLPDSVRLKRWTVYVDPFTNRVTRIFMVKDLENKKQLQLTWLADSTSKVLQLKDSSGNVVIEKETIIKWDFDE